MDYAAWIGRSETVADVAGADRIAGLHALLDHAGPPPSLLPPLGHWMLAVPRVAQSAIGPDGHPKRGGDALIPPIALPRRMWAGSQVSFLGDVAVGASVVRRSTIVAIEAKRGATGALVFVTLEHDIVCEGVPAIRERQDIVYREAPTPGAPPPRPPSDLPPAETTRVVTPDAVALFRYSALTFNGHRIHYDRDYARGVEGYPGLVVHGPYLATLLLDVYQAAHPGAAVRGFAFRARSPIFDTAPFTLCGAGERLWVLDHLGQVAMTAEVERG